MTGPGRITPDQWERVEDLFHQALELEAPEREAVFAGAAPDVSREARAMVAAFEAAEKTRAAGAPTRPPVSSGPGSRLGPYLIEREISHGGMGTVYLARRDDAEFEQKVAIKVIRPGFSSEEISRRFRTERQILATLDHPNIARLLDGGSTSQGQPYLVMEFIEGEDLLAFAHSRALSREQRLRLFLKICSGVCHAHRHLVIHRDLKPANILVTAGGEPRLLDFGIAKLIETGPEATATGLGFFSPLYASPEQLSGDPVTTSTDVYSLGVVLFELLCGRRPYRLQTTSNAELVAAILLREPDKPRGEQRLPADLEAIVFKALGKKPAERYPSVEQFAADVERFLAHRPVSARKSTWSHQARKFVQRNKLAAAAVGLAVVATAGGVTSTLVQAQRAERHFQEVRQLAQYLAFDFHDAISRLPGSTQLQKDAVERSMRYLDRLSVEAAGDAGLQIDLAEAYLRMGDVLGNPFNPNLGESKKAVETYRKSMAAADAVLALDAASDRARRVAANSRMQLGSTQGWANSRTEALGLIEESIRLHGKRLAAAPRDAERQLDYARSLTAKAVVQSQSGGYERSTGPAGETLRQALDHLRKALSEHPAHPGLLREQASALYRLSNLSATTDPNKAIALTQQALATMDKISGPLTTEVGFHRMRAGIRLSLAWSQAQAGAHDDAIANYDQAFAILGPISEADPANVAARSHLTSVYRGRGLACAYAGRLPCALENFLQAAELHRQLLEKEPGNTSYAALRGELLTRAATIEVGMARHKSAHGHASTGIALLTGLADRRDAALAHKLEACRALSNTPVIELRDTARAVAYCEQAIGPETSEYYAFEVLGNARYKDGQKAKAIEAMEKALTLIPANEPGKPASFARTSIETNLALMRAGKPVQ